MSKSFGLTKTVLSARDLVKSFGGQVVLDEIDLALAQGEVVLLRGDNGSGKTTLLNLLTGNLRPDSGTISFEGESNSCTFSFSALGATDLLTSSWSTERLARNWIARTWQDIRLFNNLSILNNIVLATPGQPGERLLTVLTRPLFCSRFEQQAQSAALYILHRLGLRDRCNSYSDKISLGQAKRVGIARTLQSGASILLLDEPLAGLDNAGKNEVLAFMEELISERRVSIVVVEHQLNISRLLPLVDKVWTLKDGKLSVQEPSAVSEELAEHKSTVIDLLQAKTQNDSRLTHQDLGGGAKLSIFSKLGAGPREVSLEVRKAVVHRGRRFVIGLSQAGDRTGVSFRLFKGDIALLQAPNGWGKTTLFEALAGILPLTDGTVYLDGININPYPVWDRKKAGLSYLQSRNNCFKRLTVKDALKVCHSKIGHDYLLGLLDRKASNLSGGEKQRLALACSYDATASVYMMDEPFSALDSRGLRDIMQLIDNAREMSYLFAVPSL